jgi:hypothetical protein
MFSLIFADVKIVRIKLCELFKFATPKQAHDAPFPFDKFPPPKLLYGPIDVDGRKAKSIGEILLRERKIETVLLQ